MSTSLPPGTPPPDAPSRLPISRLAAYGGPTLGLGYLLFFVQFYFLKFATDVLLLAPAVIGVAMMGAKLWDAVSDPLVGTWSDRTRSRLGRRRPWMLASLPVLLVSFAALWRPPGDWGSAGVTFFCVTALVLFYTGFTLYTVPHGSLGAELSPDPHQRTRAFAVRQMSWTVGLFLTFAAIQIARKAESPRDDTALLALATGGAAVLLLSITPLPCESPRPTAAAGVPACGRRGETCWAPDTRGSSCWCGSSKTWAWVCSARWRRSSSSTCFEDRT
jgi:GPH family glycoside/pentoside/hexuronide:cation symporter